MNITDALTVGSLTAYWSVDHRGVLAAQVGMAHLLCVSGHVHGGQVTTDALTTALASNQLDHTDFVDTAERVRVLRNGLG
jgi:predicted MPP superfamily phosphohydrolase